MRRRTPGQHTRLQRLRRLAHHGLCGDGLPWWSRPSRKLQENVAFCLSRHTAGQPTSHERHVPSGLGRPPATPRGGSPQREEKGFTISSSSKRRPAWRSSVRSCEAPAARADSSRSGRWCRRRSASFRPLVQFSAGPTGITPAGSHGSGQLQQAAGRLRMLATNSRIRLEVIAQERVDGGALSQGSYTRSTEYFVVDGDGEVANHPSLPMGEA